MADYDQTHTAVPLDRRRTAIVTGAASGMGRATAHLFADEGALVVVADLGTNASSRSSRRSAPCTGPTECSGARATWPILTSCGHSSSATIGAFGGIDIVINNAGVALPTSMFEDDDLFESHWATTLDVNLTAHARLVRYALPALDPSRDGWS